MAADVEPRKHRSPWIWVSLLLGVVAVGLLVWALAVKSDRDSTSQQLSSTEQELVTTTKQLDASQQQVEQLESEQTSDRRKRVGGALVAAGGLGVVKAVYDDLAKQLGATEEELETTQNDLDAATKAADEAAADAKAAKRKASQADSEADEAQAETEQAKAEAKAAKSKNAVVADCVRAYVSAFGGLFEGDSVEEQEAVVRKQLEDVTDDCKGALEGL